MNGAHWHLVLNHLPIIIPMVGLLVMFGGILVKSEVLKRAAFSIFILGAITTIAAFSTGEGAEEVVEGIQGIDEQLIKVHEEVAETFAILLYILGGISLFGLWASWKEKTFAIPISYLTITLALIGLIYAQQTGATGGEIRHTEIRVDSLTNGTIIQKSEADDDDDDK
jgi:uncharacterized membrane protein